MKHGVVVITDIAEGTDVTYAVETAEEVAEKIVELGSSVDILIPFK